VTVLMSVYNDAEYLSDAIDSVLGQSFEDFEFIVVDDGSTDGSGDVVAGYRDPRLVVVRQAHRGLVGALNRGLSMARGRYVARQDADDVSLRDRLLKQAAFLDAHGDIALVGSAVGLIDEGGRLLREQAYPEEHSELCGLLEQVINPLPHSTVMFRRDAVIALGGYDERFPKAQDYALYLRLTEEFRVASIPEMLVLLRTRPDSVTFTDDQGDQLRSALLARSLALVRRLQPEGAGGDPVAWAEFAERFERWFRRSALPRRFAAGKHRRAAEAYWQHARMRSLALLWRALWLDPWWPARQLLGRQTKFWSPSLARQVLELAKACGGKPGEAGRIVGTTGERRS
jgi:glycosyltransferase involved in cell wall biosynthesis